MKKIPFGILGGGFAGLMAGRELNSRNQEFLILEREDTVGGLARTTNFSGLKAEFGPHALYSKDERVMEFFKSLPIAYYTYNRKVRICHRGSDKKIYELNYPFENGLGNLPPEERADCLLGYIECYSRKRHKFNNLKDWINQGLGYGIAKYFMIPYNKKIWNAPLDKISLDLIKQKIDPASIKELVKACVGLPTIGRIYQSIFLYPKKGTGEISKAISESFKQSIICNSKIKKISISKKGILIKTEKDKYLFEKVISTIPLPEMINKQNLKSLKPFADKFVSNKTYFVAVRLKENRQLQRFHDCHWVFFAGSEIFYRMNVMQAYSPEVTPGIVAEITAKGKIKQMSIKRIEEEVIQGLLNDQIIKSEDDIESVSTKLVPFTYPIPTMGIDHIKVKVQRVLEPYHFYLLGRNGNWDYINMDQIVIRCWKLFEKLDAKYFKNSM